MLSLRRRLDLAGDFRHQRAARRYRPLHAAREGAGRSAGGTARLDLPGAAACHGWPRRVCLGPDRIRRRRRSGMRLRRGIGRSAWCVLVFFMLWERAPARRWSSWGCSRTAPSPARISARFSSFRASAILFFLPMTLIVGLGPQRRAGRLHLLAAVAAIACFSGPSGSWSDRIGPRLPLTLGAA